MRTGAWREGGDSNGDRGTEGTHNGGHRDTGTERRGCVAHEGGDRDLGRAQEDEDEVGTGMKIGLRG